MQGAKRCSEGAAELRALAHSQGRTPTETGSAVGALHRGWMILRETMAKQEDKAILEECERGEDYAKAQYEKALAKDLPIEVRAIVARQYEGVRANHDRVRALRDRYRVAPPSG